RNGAIPDSRSTNVPTFADKHITRKECLGAEFLSREVHGIKGRDVNSSPQYVGCPQKRVLRLSLAGLGSHCFSLSHIEQVPKRARRPSKRIHRFPKTRSNSAVCDSACFSRAINSLMISLRSRWVAAPGVLTNRAGERLKSAVVVSFVEIT